MLGSPGLYLQDDLGLVDMQARGEALVRHADLELKSSLEVIF